MIDAGARGYRLQGVFRSVEAFRCPHCRGKFRAGSSVVFYPQDPEWQWGCESCGQMWVHVLKDASARNLAADAAGLPDDRLELDWADEARQPGEPAPGGEPLAYDASPDLDD